MWLGQDPSNSYQLKAKKYGGCQCQEIGELIDNQIHISRVNPCHFRSQLQMESPKYSQTLFHQIGHLGRPFLTLNNSKMRFEDGEDGKA